MQVEEGFEEVVDREEKPQPPSGKNRPDFRIVQVDIDKEGK